MATYEAFDGQVDYSWDDLDIIDRPWDDWFGAKWNPGGLFQNTFSSLTYGTWSTTSTPLASFSQTTNGTWSTTAYPSSAFSQLTYGTWSTTSYPNSVFTIVGDLNFNPALIGTLSITGAFSPVVNANFDPADMFGTLHGGAFSLLSNGNIEFESPATLSSVFSQVTNATYLNAFAASFISALHSQLTEARYIVLADPYNLANTIQETRIYKLLAENKVIQLKMENRLNTINQETRVNLMNQETRVYKIKRPGFTDKTTIPRVRGN
jgi:hypothetical protein